MIMDRLKWTGPDNRTYVTYTQKNPEGYMPREVSLDAFTITVSPSGVSFKGKMIGEMSDQADLQDFAKIMGDVWKDRLKLRVHIVAPDKQ